MGTKLIRAFLAIEISGELKKEIKGFLDTASLRDFSTQSGGFRLIDPENWHLTLHFFGGAEKEGVERIGRHLRDSLKNTPSFSIKLMGSGGFPSLRAARVFWVGIGEGKSEAIRLKSEVDQILLKLGFEVEKRSFEPHITIARSRHARGAPISGHIAPFSGTHRSPVTHITLFQSTLTPQGARYSVLEKIPLAPQP